MLNISLLKESCGGPSFSFRDFGDKIGIHKSRSRAKKVAAGLKVFLNGRIDNIYLKADILESYFEGEQGWVYKEPSTDVKEEQLAIFGELLVLRKDKDKMDKKVFDMLMANIKERERVNQKKHYSSFLEDVKYSDLVELFS